MEIPPKPSKKAVKIMLRESFLHATEDMEWIPFVISKSPDRIPPIKLVSIFKNSKRGVKKSVKLCNSPTGFKDGNDARKNHHKATN